MYCADQENAYRITFISKANALIFQILSSNQR